MAEVLSVTYVAVPVRVLADSGSGSREAVVVTVKDWPTVCSKTSTVMCVSDVGLDTACVANVTRNAHKMLNTVRVVSSRNKLTTITF